MSHLETSTHFTSLPANLRPVVEYSPEEYRTLSRQKYLAIISAVMAIIAEIALLCAVDFDRPVIFAATVVMAWPTFLLVMETIDINRDFRRNRTVISRGFVREVRKMLRRAAQRRSSWPRSSALTIELSVMKFPEPGHNDMFLELVSKGTPSMAASYRVSPTSVTTKYGSTLQEVFGDLKQYLNNSGNLVEVESNIISKLHLALPDVDRAQAYAAYGPLDTASPTDLMGD